MEQQLSTTLLEPTTCARGNCFMDCKTHAGQDPTSISWGHEAVPRWPNTTPHVPTEGSVWQGLLLGRGYLCSLHGLLRRGYRALGFH